MVIPNRVNFAPFEISREGISAKRGCETVDIKDVISYLDDALKESKEAEMSEYSEGFYNALKLVKLHLELPSRKAEGEIWTL